MRTSKKWLALMIAVCMIVLGACSQAPTNNQSSQASSAGTTSQAADPADGKTLTIAFPSTFQRFRGAVHR